MKEIEEELSAYSQGKKARFERKSETDNPFDPETEDTKYYDWMDGYFDAMETEE